MFAPENRIRGYAMNIDGGIIRTMLPNLGIRMGYGPHTGHFPINFNFPNALFHDFSFHHGPLKSRPLVGWKHYFLIGSGRLIEPKYLIEVGLDAVVDFQRFALIYE
jgi:hypothetical protein